MGIWSRWPVAATPGVLSNHAHTIPFLHIETVVSIRFRGPGMLNWLKRTMVVGGLSSWLFVLMAVIFIILAAKHTLLPSPRCTMLWLSVTLNLGCSSIRTHQHSPP